MPKPPDPSFQDSLTGLSNRRHFEILYDFAFHLGRRGVSLSLVQIEAVGVSDFREREGDDAADAALRTLGRILSETTRVMDVAARLEEGRFISLLMDCNLHGSLVYADRIRDVAAGFSSETKLPICAGVASYEEGMETPDDLLERSRATLVMAVGEGGKRIGLPEDLPRAG